MNEPQNKNTPPMDGLTFACHAARIADEHRSEAVIVLDLRGISPVTDFFVIATGTSQRQMQAVTDKIKQFGKENGVPPYHISGYDSSSWILLDCFDVVVHLFDHEHRHYYDLELLWGDAPKVDWQNTPCDQDQAPN